MAEEKCDCGHEYCGGVKYWQEDPFAAEIYGDYELVFMCDGDAHESAMDI